MPTSKTDTAMRFPGRDDQQRRMWTTQDKKAAAKAQNELSSGQNKSQESTTWTADQMLGSHMNAAGNPEPDPASFGDGAKAKKQQKGLGDEPDLYEAMNAETADLD